MKIIKQNLIGYACQNLDVEDDVYRTCRIERFNAKVGHDLIAENLKVLEGMIDYNIKHGLKMFRITSSLVPFASNKQIFNIDWTSDFASELKIIKNKIVSNNIRISVHPGQYTVLNSLNDDVITRSILELEYHVDILESLGGTQNSKMIVHIGGVFGDKGAAIDRFVDVVNSRLSKKIKKHLIIENDDRHYNVEEVLYISEKTGLPFVFDNLHNECNPSPGKMSERELIIKAFSTWRKEDGRPKIHYSQQAPNKKIGAHTQTINAEKFYEFYQSLADLEFDIMLEVKDKNRSAIKISLLLSNDFNEAEKEWARYKYLVLGKSQGAYGEIREMLKDKENFSSFGFYKTIDDALLLEENVMREIIALEHVYGYFKKVASEKEKQSILKLINQYKNRETSLDKIKAGLKRLAKKYNESYLLSSYYFDFLSD